MTSDQDTTPPAPGAQENVPDEPVITEQPPAADLPTRADVATARPEPEHGTPRRENRRKVRDGIVDSNSMDKTVVVKVVERVRHPKYGKTVQRTKRLYAHDERNELNKGDRVRVQETRPLSKLKRWRVVEILERAR